MKTSLFITAFASLLHLGLAGCDSGGSQDGACCRLAALSVCDCAALSYEFMAAPAVSSGDPDTCQMVMDEVLYDEGFESAEALCGYDGSLTCYFRAMQTCD